MVERHTEPRSVWEPRRQTQEHTFYPLSGRDTLDPRRPEDLSLDPFVCRGEKTVVERPPELRWNVLRKYVWDSQVPVRSVYFSRLDCPVRLRPLTSLGRSRRVSKAYGPEHP